MYLITNISLVYEEDKEETPTITPTTLNTVYYPDIRLELQDLEIICPLSNSTKVR